MIKTAGIVLIAAGVVLIAAGIAAFFITDARHAAKALMGTRKMNREMPETEDIVREIYYSSDNPVRMESGYRGKEETARLNEKDTQLLVIEPGNGTKLLDLNVKSRAAHDTEMLKQ